MKRYILSLILLAGIAITGCYKDKGNYDLQEINKISMKSDARDTINVLQFDTAKMNPVVSQTMPIPETRLIYKWSAYLYSAPIGGSTAQTLSTQKNLNVPIGLKPDKYTLLYTVTDTETGVSYFKKFFMEVSSKLSEGWLMINEKADKSRDIDLLNANGTVVRDIYRTANSENLPDGAYSIKILATFFNSAQNIIILSEKDAVRVNYASFLKLQNAKDWFVSKPEQLHPENYAYNTFGSATFMVTNGSFYGGQVDLRFGAPLGGDHKISKFIYAPGSNDAGILYDTKNQRFLNYSNNAVFTFSIPANAAFNMNQIGKELIAAGKAPGDNFNYLMKDNGADAFYIYRVNNGGAAGLYNVSAAAELKNAKLFAFSGMYMHVYYAVGNNIYLLDIEKNSAKIIYTFPAGEEVTAMCLKQSHSTWVGYADNNRTLAVGTFNNNAGKVYTFSIDGLGGFTDHTFTKEYKGLEKPVFLEFKNRK